MQITADANANSARHLDVYMCKFMYGASRKKTLHLEQPELDRGSFRAASSSQVPMAGKVFRVTHPHLPGKAS